MRRNGLPVEIASIGALESAGYLNCGEISGGPFEFIHGLAQSHLDAFESLVDSHHAFVPYLIASTHELT